MRRMDGYLIRVGQRVSQWKGDICKLQNCPVIEPIKEDALTATVLPLTFTTTHVYHFKRG